MTKPSKVDYNPKLLQILCYFGFFIPLLVIFVDTPMLPKQLQLFYIIGRLGTAGVCLGIFLQSKFGKPRTWHLPLFFLTISAYSIHGQIFLPCYYLAYMESIVLLGIFFTASKKMFYTVMAFSVVGMSLAVLYSSASYGFQTESMATKFKFDALCGVIITSLLSCIGYKHIATTRKQKDIIAEKFLDLGCQVGALMHDFKNLLVSPIMAVSLLKRTKTSEQRDTLIVNLEKDLNFLHRYVHETNTLSHTVDSNEFRLSEIHDSLNIILRNQLENRQFTVKEDCPILAEKSMFMKVFYNLVMNSVQVNATNIEIGSDGPNEYYFKDNGPGFTKKYLKTINSGDCIYAETGRSIGIYLIKHMLESRGHKAIFSNQETGGAFVRIIL